MLNAEKYKDRILEVASDHKVFGMDTKNNKIDNCSSISCRDCLFYTFGTISEHDVNRIKWLLSEYKEPVKLTELEHGILEYLLEKRQYRFVVRERNGIIYAYKSKPKKEADSWESLSLNNELGLFNNLFQFVKWEDSAPTAIEDVLNNCEVVDDD